MKLTIKQSNTPEIVTSELIDRLYILSSGGGDLTNDSELEGNLQTTAAYEDSVDYLTSHFPKLAINAASYYIRFADPAVEEVLKISMGKDESEGITAQEAANTFANYFQNNTYIEGFDELKYFKTGNYIFSGCTNLKSVDITDKYGNFNNCTNLVNWYGGRKPNGYLYIDYHLSWAQNCPGLTELEIGEDALNLNNNEFTGSTNIEIVRCKPVANYEFGWPAFRGNPVKNIYIENMDNWLTCRTYGSGMIDSNTKIFYNNQLVTSVEIPQTLTQIGANNGGCFAEYRYLTSVQFHSGITSIAGGTFDKCTNLVIQDLNLPNLTTLGSYAFRGTKTQAISSLGNIASIGDYCFADCTQLERVMIPNTVTSIGGFAFNNCTNTTRIDITDLNKYFKVDFRNYASSPACSSQNGAYLYLNGTKVEGTITLPTGMSNTTAKLAGLKGITEVIIPNDVHTIGEYFAYNNKDLTSITIPSGVTSIGRGAFQQCRIDGTLSIPNTITSIPDYAFSTSQADTLIIPDSVITIDGYVCMWGMKLNSLIIGSGVTSIRSGFRDSNIGSITIYAINPPSITDNSGLIGTTIGAIFVPQGSVEAYREASTWSSKASIIQAIPTT